MTSIREASGGHLQPKQCLKGLQIGFEECGLAAHLRSKRLFAPLGIHVQEGQKYRLLGSDHKGST